jgi:hypothetical protein
LCVRGSERSSIYVLGVVSGHLFMCLGTGSERSSIYEVGVDERSSIYQLGVVSGHLFMS